MGGMPPGGRVITARTMAVALAAVFLIAFIPVSVSAELDAPDAPTDLTATHGNGMVTLTWTAPASSELEPIDNYVVYEGESGSKIADTGSSATSYDVTGLNNGQTYTFRVAAHNISGTGPMSNAATATPQQPITVPGQPTNLQATPGNGQISLTWAAPSDGGAEITHYTVMQGSTVAATTTATSTTIAGLTNGQSYTYTVIAHNSVGPGQESGPATAVPRNVPGAPTNLVANAGNAQVTLSWTAPSDGGASIDHYVVYQNGLAVQQPSSTSATIAGLVNGQSYSFTVSAHNAAGDGPNSSASSATPQLPTTVPGQPTNLQATPGNGQVTLTWAAPASDGGAAIDYYVVLRDGVDVGHPTSTSLTITGLADGTAYNFTVAAHNQVGTGLQSLAVQATPSPTVTIPGAPTSLTASPGDGHISIAWTAPSNNGGATIDHYVVFLDGVDVLHTNSTSANLTGLLNGRSYTIAVAAHNSVGTSPPSPTVTASPSTSVASPGAPTSLTSVNWKDQVFLSWSPPGNDGGAAIEYYIVYQDGIEVARSNQTSMIIDGLVTGQRYMFSVAAHNHVGDGARSEELEVVPSNSVVVPGSPTQVVAVAGDGTVTLTWSRPSDGGATVDYYIVYQNGVDIAHTSGTSIVINGLTNGRSYEFTVAAHGPGGKGQTSSAAYATPHYGSGTTNILLGALIAMPLVGLLLVVVIRKKWKGPGVGRSKPSATPGPKVASGEQRTCPRCWKPVSGNYVCEHCGMDLRKP